MNILSSWLNDLGAQDANLRENALVAIYDHALNQARDTISSLQADPAMSGLLTGSMIAAVAVSPGRFLELKTAWDVRECAKMPAALKGKISEFTIYAPKKPLDILTTEFKGTGEPDAISKFLSNRGEGIQHIELYVTDVEKASQCISLISALNASQIHPAPIDGADNTKINFFLCRPKNSNKILIELVQAP
ncbi:hypothetical protein ACFL6Y_03295 [Elusimicrobiota bacterium]